VHYDLLHQDLFDLKDDKEDAIPLSEGKGMERQVDSKDLKFQILS